MLKIVLKIKNCVVEKIKSKIELSQYETIIVKL